MTWASATKGNVDLESVIARQPDLMIAQLRARPALMESGVIDKLSALHVPVLFVDYEIDPAKDTAPSIDLLGKVLNRESRAKAFTDYYRQQLQTIRQKTAAITPKANVFVEALAGNSDACCFTHGHSGWGGLVEAVRAEQYRFAAAAGRLRVRLAGENHQHEARRLDHDRLEARQQPGAAPGL